MKDIVLPFKVLISPIKTFSQLALNPSWKGLVSLSALILVANAAALYASAAKIILNIDGPTSFLVTDAFNGWFASNLASSSLSILLYWLLFASILVLISRLIGGKEVSWRVLLLSFAYLLSVFIILYAVRAVMYLALPSIYFDMVSSWPPMDEAQVDAVLNRMTESWGSLYVYQFGTIFTFVAFVWLVILGAIAVKALREVSWGKAVAVAVIGFSIALFLFGPP